MSWQREATSQQLLLRIQPSWLFLCINICLYILFILKEEGIGKQSFSKSKISIPHLGMCSSSCAVVCPPAFFLIADVTVESKFSLLMPWKTSPRTSSSWLTWAPWTGDEASQLFKKKKKKAEVKKTHCFMNPQHNPETAAHLSHLIPIR